MDGRTPWTDCDEAGDYVVPNVLSPRDLVFRPDNMDETVPHTNTLMNVFAKFDEIPSMILQDIKETKRYGHTFVRSFGQRENSIPSHKHSLRGGGYKKWLR